MKKRIGSIFLVLALCMTLLPTMAIAADFASATADFTADNGTAALALLNATKTGTEDSTWENETKTLTLKGVDFTTTATTAVKLPDGATIVLADGTRNTIQGGNAMVDQAGKHNNQIYIYGIYADGALTIQGGAEGTGTLSVTSGDHTNSGNAWTYSVALYTAGELTVESGTVTANGGKASSADCAFSHGVELAEGGDLTVTGGSLIGIGGESLHKKDPNDEYDNDHESFSEGFDLLKGNVSVTGGKLEGKCVSAMDGKGLAYGIRITSGELNVSGGEVSMTASQPISISNGALELTSGRISAVASSDSAAVSVTKEFNSGTGNIEVSGGILETIGKGVYMYQSNATEQQGLFKVSGGSVKTPSIYGAKKLTISSGTVESGSINADDVALSGGSLTIREPVHCSNTGNLYVSHALYCDQLTVSGGTLDAAWDWGDYTPIVFPTDEHWGYAQPLIKALGGTANFNGGTATFDTGCAGNTALKVETLNLGTGIVGSGYTHAESSDTYLQENGSVPVRFGVFQPTSVTLSGITAKEKVYDGTVDAELDLTNAVLDGVETDDDVGFTMSGVTAKFADKNVGTDKNITVTGSFLLTGADADKYTLTQPDLRDLKADITACTTFTDATTKTQTTYVGSGSFETSKFTGVTVNGKAEEVTGSVVYTLNSTAKTVTEIGEDLKALKTGEKLDISYTFTASGNYDGTKTGTITVTAQNRPSSSSGSSGYYVSTPSKTENGTMTVNPRYASKGSTVTITVKPEDGFKLSGLTVTDKDGNVLTLTDKGDGKYTFTMPAGKVEVKATFAEEIETSPFADVAPDAYYYEAVKWAADKGITEGTGNGLFGSNTPCTRAQIVTFLWRAAGSPEPKGTMAGMTDVVSGSYYEKAVAWAIENGVTTGTTATTFSPDATCTRAQAVTFLARALNAKAASAAEFSDVPTGSYFADAVAWAAANGVTEGVGNGLFAPNNECTRAQIVTFLWRAYNTK